MADKVNLATDIMIISLQFFSSYQINFQDTVKDFTEYRAYLIVAVVLTACCKIVSINLQRNYNFSKVSTRKGFLEILKYQSARDS